MLRVGIAGAGAVGCHYGSFLQQSGMEVAYLARGEHLAALKKHGLTHISNGEARHLQVQASDDSSILTACDVVLFACKTTVLDELCKQISPAIKSTALLISMQNGVTAPDQLAACFPEHSIMAASAFIGVRIDRPGTVVHSAAGHLRLGFWNDADASALELIGKLIDVWNQAGVDAQQVADMRSMLWHKMLWNCGFNAMTALTRRYARDLAADEDSVRWVRAAMEETIDVAAACGARLANDAIDQHLTLTMKAGPVKTSMWQDLEHGRPTEIEAINGFVARKAKALGLDAPVNDLLSSMIRSAEQG